MRPRERRDSGQNDLFRARLDQIIDIAHPLVARQSGWEGGDSQDGHFGGRGGGDDCRGATITQALFGMRADCRGATIRTIP